MPAVALAVNTTDVATPLALVVAVFTPPAKVPLAPVVGAVNVTVTPLTGLLPASFTVACSEVAKAVLIVALCGVPVKSDARFCFHASSKRAIFSVNLGWKTSEFEGPKYVYSQLGKKGSWSVKNVMKAVNSGIAHSCLITSPTCTTLIVFSP